jgi:hypothetical protein
MAFSLDLTLKWLTSADIPLTDHKKNWSERFSPPQCCHGIQFCI